mmetsp:Transcript_4423/g.5412  ORF Transcript_4423/g.5412 Transcript_4423/m.5412 type:complete len:180 (+) Transcript_4423:117-656(+)
MASPELMSGLGAAAAIFFSAAGSAIASAQSGIFAARASYSSSGIWIYAPIVISGVLAIYGLIIGIIIQCVMGSPDLDIAGAYRLFSAGLVVGLGCFSSGIGMSRYLDMYIKGYIETNLAQRAGSNMSVGENTENTSLLNENSVFVARTSLPVTWDAIFTMVFLEAIGLYSLIVALFLTN